MLSLTFENVTKRFGKTVAVDNFSLEIRTGELFFLLGPSGCGKTTCLRMVAGFAEPDEGVIRFGDRVINAVPPHRRNTGMVFQNYALWPHLTVRGNVEYGLKVRKVPRAERDARVAEALEMVRLTGLDDRYPNQLSGGQQQRVALARALIIRPDILLLDEPLSNLDAQLRLEMRREIKRLHEQTGVTALYVTHDQEEALSIADRIAIMRDGVLQQVGTPRELYRQPVSRFVAEFIGQTNLIPGTLSGREGEWAVIETPVGKLRGLAANGATLTPGQGVWCSIRPESWRVEDGAKAGAATDKTEVNLLPARLDDLMYLGDSDQYQVRLASTQNDGRAATEEWRTVKVKVTNPPGGAPQPGAPLTLSCRPADVVVLTA
jgi:iron(III) transport system ATP-binding protein